MKNRAPNKAKLITDGGFYRYVHLKGGPSAKIVIPIMRKIKLAEPTIDYNETWHFQLVFVLQRVLKNHAEYRQVDSIKVVAPTKDVDE